MKAGSFFKQYDCHIEDENNLLKLRNEKISFFQISDITQGSQQWMNVIIGIVGFFLFFLTGITFIRQGEYLSGILTLLLAEGIGVFLFFIFKVTYSFKGIYKLVLKNNRIIFVFAENEEEKSSIENMSIKVQELNASAAKSEKV